MSGTTKASPNNDAYVWIGGPGGSWQDPASWRDQTTGTQPAGFIPGAATPVTIANAGSITGGGVAAGVSLTGGATLDGGYDLGAAHVGRRVAVAFADPVYTAGTLALVPGAQLALATLQVTMGSVTLAAGGPATRLLVAGAATLGTAPTASEAGIDDGAAGSATIGAGATLAVGAALAVAQGSLSVGGAGALGTVAGAVTLGGGDSFRAAGVLTVSAGGTLSVSGGLDAVYGGALVTGAGSLLRVLGTMTAAAPVFSAGLAGDLTLAVRAGGRAQLGGLSIQGVATNGVVAASRIGVDLTGAIEIGDAGAFTAGAITVDAGRSLSVGSDAVLTGALINQGTVIAAGGTLTLAGSLSGGGLVQIGRNATLALGGEATGGSIAFTAPGGRLVIGAGHAVAASIGGFAGGDAIVLAGVQADHAVYTATGPGSGTLELSAGGGVLARLSLSGSYVAGNFALSALPGGSTAIGMVAAGGPVPVSTGTDAFAWTGASGGSWGDGGNWRNLATGDSPVTAVPGAGSPVSIAASGGTLHVAGAGSSATLTVTGGVALDGAAHTGLLAVGTRSLAGAEAAYAAGTLELAAASDATRAAVVSGALAVTGTAALTVLGELALGSAAGAPAGQVDGGAAGAATVAAGASLLAGSLLVSQGSLAVAGGTARILGGGVLGTAGTEGQAGFAVVSDGGTLQVGAGLAALHGGGVARGAGSRLIVGGVFTAGPAAFFGATPFGFVSLSATDFGRIQVDAVVIPAAAGSVPASLAVDLTGAIEIGAAGTAAAGSITVNAGHALSAAGDAVLTGAVVNDGTLLVTGGTLTLAGRLSGTGEARIGAGATLRLGGDASGRIAFLADGAVLEIAAGVDMQATVAGLQIGDTILFDGIVADQVLYLPSGAAGGTLSLFSGTRLLANLALEGSYSASDFVLGATAGGAASVGLLPPVTSGEPDPEATDAHAYVWTGASGAEWASAGNWRDATAGIDPAVFVPGPATPASIQGAAGGSFLLVTGGGGAASLSLTGNVGLGGFYQFGTLAVGSRDAPPESNASYVAGGLALSGLAGVAADSVVVARGTLALAGSGSALSAGTVSLGAGARNLDFWFDPGATGVLRVGAGASLEAQSLAVQQGTLAVGGLGAQAQVAGAVSLGQAGAEGAGFLVVSAGAALSIGGDVAALHGGIVVTGAGASLSLHGVLHADAPAFYAAPPFGNTSLTAVSGGRADIGGLVIGSAGAGAVPASLAVDLTGAIEIGFDGTGAAGRITVDAGHAIAAGADLVLTGAVVNNGSIVAGAGTLTLAGSLSGSGVVRIGAGATLALAGDAAAGERIVFDGATGTLLLGSRTTTSFANGIPVVTRAPYAVAATISGVSAGTAILVADAVITSVVYAATGPSLGTLRLMNGATLVTTLTLSGNYGASSFTVSQAGSASLIGVLAGPPVPSVRLFAPTLAAPGQEVTIGAAQGVVAGDALQLVLDAPAGAGTLRLLDDGSLRYTAPAAGAALPVALLFHVTDASGRASGLQSVALTVDPGPSLRPVAVAVAAGQAMDLTARLLAMASPGVAGDRLAITAAGAPASGSASLLAGRLRYVGGGAADSLGYVVTDQLGTQAGATLRVLSPAALRGGIGVAAALAAGATLPSGSIVTDTAQAVAAGLDGLAALARSGRLLAIGLLDPDAVLAITAAQAAADIDALALVATPYVLAQRILAAEAGGSLAAGFQRFAVLDSAAAVQAALPVLAGLAGGDRLAEIRLTDGGTPVLHMSAAALPGVATALAAIAGPHAVALTDAGVPALALAGSQYDAGLQAAVLAHVTTPFTVTVTSPIRAAALVGLLAQGGAAALPAGLVVQDDAAAIAAALPALQQAAAAGRLAAIVPVGAGPQLLALSAAARAASPAALALLPANAVLVQATGAAALATATLDPHFAAFFVQDDAASILARLPAIDAAVRAGRVAGLQVTGGAGLTLTAAELASGVLALSLQPGLVLRLSDGGTPVVTFAAGLLANPAVRALLDAVVDPFTLLPVGAVSAATAVAIGAEGGQVLASLGAPLAISDTAAGIAASLTGLAGLLAKGRLGAITLRDAGAVPVLNISTADATAFAGVLARIASPYGVPGFFGSAGNFLAQLETLDAQARVNPALGFALTGAAPTLTLTAARLLANAVALSRITGGFAIVLSDAGTPALTLSGTQAADPAVVAILGRIAGAFTLSVTGPVDAAAAAGLATLAARLAAPLVVSDDGAGLAANLAGLQALAEAGRLAVVTQSDAGSLPLTAAQLAGAASVLALMPTPPVTSSAVTAAAAAASLAGPFARVSVRDTAPQVLAQLPALQALAQAGRLDRILLADPAPLSLSAAVLQANAAALARSDVPLLVLTDAGTPVLRFTAAALADPALRALLDRVGGAFSLVVADPVGATLARALAGEALLLAHLSGGLVVQDDAGQVRAALPELQALAAAGRLAAIRLTGASVPALGLTGAEATGYAAALAVITTPYNVTAATPVSVSLAAAAVAGQLAALQAQALAGTLGDIALTDAGTPALSLTAAQFVAGGRALARIAGAFSVALTDAGTPVLTLTAGEVAAMAALLGRVTTVFRLQVTGPVDAATALALAPVAARLVAQLAVADHASALAAAMDGLQAAVAAGWVAAIGSLDGGWLTLTATQAAADAAALALIAGPVRRALRTDVAGATALPSGFSAYWIEDTPAQLVAGLAGLDLLPVAGIVPTVPALSLTAAAFAAHAASLARLQGAVAVTLLDAGTPVLALTAGQLADPALRALLARITGGFGLALTGPVTAELAAALWTEGGVVRASLAAGPDVLDSAAAVAAYMPVLEAMAVAGRLHMIVLTDPGLAALQLGAAQIAASSHALALIAGPFIAGVAGGAVVLTAAALLTQLDSLQAQAASLALTRISLTDAGVPVLAISAARLQAAALALGLIATPYVLTLTDPGPVVLQLSVEQAGNAGVRAMLGRLASPVTLAVEAPLSAAGAAGLASLAPLLAGPVTVADSAGAVAASLDRLQALAAAGRLGGVVLLDPGTPTLTLTAATIAADAGALAAIGSPFTVAVVATAAEAGGIAFAGRLQAVAVRDTAAAILAALPALQALAVQGRLAALQAGDVTGLSLSGAQLVAGLDALARSTLSFMLTDAGVPVLHLQAWQLTAAALAALNRVAGGFVLLVDGVVTVAEAMRFTAAGGAVLASLSDASLAIADEAAAMTVPAMTALQAMVGKIARIELHDAAAVLSLTPTQATGFATLLGRVTTPFVLSQSVSVAGLAAAVPGAGFRSLTVVDSAASIAAALPLLEDAAAAGLLGRLQPSDGAVFTLSAAAFAAALHAFAAIDAARVAITLTDPDTPLVVVPAELLGDRLLRVLASIATPYRLQVAGQVAPADAAAIGAGGGRVLAVLEGTLAVAGDAVSVAAALDGLQALQAAGHLGSLQVLDGAVLTMTAARYLADAGALARLTGSYSLALTGVSAADAATLAARPHVASVAVLDSAANVTARLEALQVLAAGGRLAEIRLTDPGRPTLLLSLARQAADAGALARIASPYDIETPVGNATGLDLQVQAYDWRSHALLSDVSVSVLGQGQAAGLLGLRAAHLDASGQVVAELWVDGGAGVQSLGFEATLPDGAAASFQRDAALPADWIVAANVDAGVLRLQGIGATTPIGGSRRLGTITLGAPGSADFAIAVSGGNVGGTAVAPFALSFGRASTDAAGQVTIESVGYDSFSLSASRSAADVGRSISAADALAALRIAVGLNPNAAPNATGTVAAPAVSPYQYLAADVNGDGRVTAADALAILRMAVHQPGAPAPRWIFVDEAHSYWDPATLKFVTTRTAVGAVAAASAAVPEKMSVSLVGVLVGAVLGRWAPLDGNGQALAVGRYDALPTSYFAAVSAATGTPLDQWGYATASTALSIDAIPVTSGGTGAAVAIYDTAANVSAALDRLQALDDAGRLLSVGFMETTTPVLSLDRRQFDADAGALARAAGIYRLDVQAGDNAARAVSLADSPLSFIGTPDMLTLRSPATTLHYDLAPSSGVLVIGNFRYGTDRLDIDLKSAGNAALVAGDTLLGGQGAITLHAAGDTASGAVLLGSASVTTASNLMALHVTFVDGHALIG